jgi:hypothetical protein
MLASTFPPMDNRLVSSSSNPESNAYRHIIAAEDSLPQFRHGALVLVTLQSPREKFFGAVLALAPYGLVFCGITLESIDDFLAQLRAGETVRPSKLFFPMHRIERLELDQSSGDVPSIAERFLRKSGLAAQQIFCQEDAG